MNLYILDLAYKVDAGFESLSIFLPLRRANFTVVASHVERSFYLANEFFCVTSDAVVLDFSNLDEAFGANQERTAVCQTIFFVEDTKATIDYASVVSKHGILDLLDAVRSVVPSLVSEVSVSAY